LDENTKARISKIEENTRGKSLTLNIAFNYGGRSEITRAFNTLVAEGKTEITEQDISEHLYTDAGHDPDLIIRTGGEMRLSNFLLWQAAYAELYFLDVLWPDMDATEVDKAIEAFTKRKRRFGGV
jgi:undecaprenyl diphosphate synthase